jgi:sec-independent protein translocase protein TatC
LENKDSHLIEHLDELRQRMINTWSVSYFFLVVLPIMITPPDFISDILVIIPLLVLYELSVIISKIAYKKKVVSDASM